MVKLVDEGVKNASPSDPQEETNVVPFPDVGDHYDVQWLTSLLSRDAANIQAGVGAVLFIDGDVRIASTNVELGDLILCSKVLESFVTDIIATKYTSYEDD